MLHLAYVRWLENFLELSCNHCLLLPLFKTRILFFPKFTTKPEPITHTFGLNLILYNIIIPASKPRAMPIVVKKFLIVKNSSFGALSTSVII